MAGNYRTEVDGLRAVAVISVILFHAGFATFSGGFVGVDVFFVISGYLITGIILTDLSRGEFSLWHFYCRRARRILPALTVVVLACIPLAWLWMLPEPLENFGQSVVATFLSANNLLLTLTSGYWDLEAEFKPLLHTWSLAVEEQFYLLFPLVLIICWPRLKLRSVYIVALICLASFAACLVFYSSAPTGTFYLLHSRAWELGIGALGAFWERSRPVRGNDRLALAGLTAIALSVLWFDETTPFPSAYTLIPVGGTLLVLMFGRRGGHVARLLQMRVLVGIGLISYSLYLWHQPVFAFARINSYEEPSGLLYAALILLCLILSVLTWRFVERPFRDPQKTSGIFVGGTLIGASLAGVVAGIALHLQQGYPARIFQTRPDLVAGMHMAYNENIRQLQLAHFPKPPRGRNVLVLGNSQGRDFANILLESGLTARDNVVYRADIALCEYPQMASGDKALVDAADIVFLPVIAVEDACSGFVAGKMHQNLNTVFVGPKHFGYNLNVYGQIDPVQRRSATARIPDAILASNAANRAILPQSHYIDLVNLLSDDGQHGRVFDAHGDMIPADRVHLTKAGAVFLGARLRDHPAVADLSAGRDP
ncbi:acyltransferase [Yoonia sp. SS1-5]|uniref:Acyltransferase family protein n=1 Tax=Yoonia rhodophyticola TaxID=3137370 RepID=A0AAN0MB22_9RHOB